MERTLKVPAFFYGSYINRAVLAEVDLEPESIEVAWLDGYEISICPLANLTPAAGHTAWGILVEASQDELKRLYAHAREVLGGLYLPNPVAVELRRGGRCPALCYIAPELSPGPATDAYIDRIVGPAREYGFPAEYIQHLESFRPQAQ